MKYISPNTYPDGETGEIYPDWTEVQAAFGQAKHVLVDKEEPQ